MRKFYLFWDEEKFENLKQKIFLPLKVYKGRVDYNVNLNSRFWLCFQKKSNGLKKWQTGQMEKTEIQWMCLAWVRKFIKSWKKTFLKVRKFSFCWFWIWFNCDYVSSKLNYWWLLQILQNRPTTSPFLIDTKFQTVSLSLMPYFIMLCCALYCHLNQRLAGCRCTHATRLFLYPCRSHVL